MNVGGDNHSLYFPVSDIEELLDITDYLLDLDKHSIYHLGIVLRLSPTAVKDWKDEHDKPIFLDRVISAWLRKEANVQQEPTWRILVEALRHRRLGQHGIADKIASEKLGVN